MTARDVALAAALAAAERELPLQDTLAESFEGAVLDRRDRALASEIAFGALRRRLQLDLALSRVVTPRPGGSRPVSRVQPALAEALRQGAYQVLFLDRVPARAAVNETVDIVKSRMGKKPAAFANACLRALSRAVRRKAVPRERIRERVRERIDEARAALASRDGLFVLLANRLLPDPERDEAGWLAGSYGYPRWMVERWLARHGRARAERILEWGNTPPALCVRLNPARTPRWPLPPGRGVPDDDEGAARVFRSCRSFRPGDVPRTYLVEAEVAPAELPGLSDGLFSIQDETQARPVRVLAPDARGSGARVLDLCAGLGGKTMQLAEAVGPGGSVVAVERDGAKLEKAREAASRLGHRNIEFVEGAVSTDSPAAAGKPQSLPAEAGTRRARSGHSGSAEGRPQRASDPASASSAGSAVSWDAGEFDWVLVDVPCSNLGSLDRRPEVRFRVSEQSIAKLAEKEAALLAAGLARLAPGGALVYSVCSFEEEETSAVVRKTLDHAPEGASGLRLVSERWVLPEPGRRDGGYCARIARER